MPFERDGGSFYASGAAGLFEPRSRAPFHLYFTVKPRANHGAAQY
jgi:hypothetical protein